MKTKLAKISGLTIVLLTILSSSLLTMAAPPVPIGILDPTTIPKFVNQITGLPPVYVPTNITDANNNVIRQEYSVNITQFTQQILPASDALGNPTGFGPTTVWGYGGLAKNAVTGATIGYVRNSPAPTFEASRGIPTRVTWINNITGPHLFPVDPTLHWANPNNIPMDLAMEQAMQIPSLAPPYPPGYNGAPYTPPGTTTVTNPNGWNAQSPVPLVTHLHGAEVPSDFDGGPDQWFTASGLHGPTYRTAAGVPVNPNAAVYEYPNDQQPATLWYHDHALGITRINVMSGLAGFYLLREHNSTLDPVAPLLPTGEFEVPLAIQDRTFYTNGQFWFPTVGVNPDMHPYWMPEFFGNTIMVNGLVWPNMNVKQAAYRFRLLDGSNARFYTLRFIEPVTKAQIPFMQIGTDGGYLAASVPLTTLTIAPGERADTLIDFSAFPIGTKIILRNFAKAPFPNGVQADPKTTGTIMQFTVTGPAGPGVPVLPALLNPTLSALFPSLPATTLTRTRTLWEVMGMLGPLEVLLNGQKWAGELSEQPKNGTTEDWIIPNLTADTHPIHLHLVQFQLVSRQKFDAAGYSVAWLAAQRLALGDPLATPPWPTWFIPVEVPVGPFIKGKPMPPALNERGWKDTVQMNPGEVTIIRVRFMSQDGAAYSFDPTLGPGYVWHCHIIDHEDNEMMRPYKVLP